MAICIDIGPRGAGIKPPAVLVYMNLGRPGPFQMAPESPEPPSWTRPALIMTAMPLAPWA